MEFTKSQAEKMARELMPLVNELLVAQVIAKCEREKIDAIKARILAEGDYRDQDTGEPITAPAYDWTMGTEKFAEYQQRIDIEVANMGYSLEPGYCPALIAEHDQRKAEWALIRAAEPYTGLTNDQLLCGSKDKGGLELRREYIDLLTRLVVNHPRYRKPELAA